MELIAVKLSALTEVCGIVVRDALPTKLLHRFGPERDEESPSISTLENLNKLILGLCRDESLVLDRSNDDTLPLVR